MGRCEWCGRGTPTPDLHHRQFRSRGGGPGAANAVALCRDCHRRAHTDAAQAAAAGFAVASWGDPSTVPVYLAPWALWALLADDGSFTFTDDQPPAPP